MLVLDVMFGKLCRWLRMFGVSCYYSNSAEDDQLLEITERVEGILVTRDKELCKRAKSRKLGCVYVAANDLFNQLLEVKRELGLRYSFPNSTRCPHCDTPLIKCDRRSCWEHYMKIPYYSRIRVDEFYYCPKCDKPYWLGSHFREIKEILDMVQ